MKIEWKSCFRVGVTLLLLIICVMALPKAGNLLASLLSAAAPLFIGCVIAYLLNILMNVYEKRYFPRSKKPVLIKSRRPVCILLVIVTLVAVIALVVALVLPQLGECVALLFSEVPKAIKAIAQYLEEWNVLSEEALEHLNTLDWKSKIEQM